MVYALWPCWEESQRDPAEPPRLPLLSPEVRFKFKSRSKDMHVCVSSPVKLWSRPSLAHPYLGFNLILEAVWQAVWDPLKPRPPLIGTLSLSQHESPVVHCLNILIIRLIDPDVSPLCQACDKLWGSDLGPSCNASIVPQPLEWRLKSPTQTLLPWDSYFWRKFP